MIKADKLRKLTEEALSRQTQVESERQSKAQAAAQRKKNREKRKAARVIGKIQERTEIAARRGEYKIFGVENRYDFRKGVSL